MLKRKILKKTSKTSLDKISLKRKYIFVFEGISGSGKKDIIKKVFQNLEKNYKVFIPKPIDKSILSYEVSHALRTSLFISNRYYQIKEIEQNKNDIILLNRYTYSTSVYQGLEANRLEENFIKLAQANFPRPDLIFYIDTPVYECINRQKDFDSKQLNKFKSFYDYLFANNTRVVRIDGKLPIEIQVNQITRRIKDLIK